MMTTLLSSVFSTSTAHVGSEYDPWIFDWGGGIDGQRTFRQGESWLAWFVLAEGPDIFWDQWWSLPQESAQNYIRDRATETFKAMDPALSDYQRLLAKKFQEAVHERAGFHTHFDESNPYRYFIGWWRSMPPGQAEKEPVKEILQHVPFLVNFRCPEELAKRSEFLVEGMEAPRATPALISRDS
jgi:hypothetical protein